MEKTKNLLSDNVRRLRNNLGMTQSELAEKANLSLIGIQGIEYGKSGGRGSTLSKIAKALGVTVEDLYRDPNEQVKQKPQTVADLTPEGLMQILEKISAKNHAEANKKEPLPNNFTQNNLTEKDKLILEVTSGLPLLEINKLKFIRDRVLAGNSGSIKSKKSVNS